MKTRLISSESLAKQFPLFQSTGNITYIAQMYPSGFIPAPPFRQGQPPENKAFWNDS